jgi:hypothetical protein
MITCLQDLQTASLQEIFDHVAGHLLKQGTQCLSGQFCDFINSSGHRCAIGSCMSEHEAYLYRGKGLRCIEGWESMPEQKRVFLVSLVDIHDDSQPSEWKENLADLANLHSLTFNF